MTTEVYRVLFFNASLVLLGSKVSKEVSHPRAFCEPRLTRISALNLKLYIRRNTSFLFCPQDFGDQKGLPNPCGQNEPCLARIYAFNLKSYLLRKSALLLSVFDHNDHQGLLCPQTKSEPSFARI